MNKNPQKPETSILLPRKRVFGFTTNTWQALSIAIFSYGLLANMGYAQASNASESASIHSSAFRKWAESGKASKERERGVDLARKRKNEVKKLIMRDPSQALKQRLSKNERLKLPPEVESELETEVEGPAVVGPLRGPLVEDSNAAPSISLTIKGNVYRAYLHGNQLKKKKWDGERVKGIAVGGHMVMEDVAADGDPEPKSLDRIKMVFRQQFTESDFTYSKKDGFDVVEAKGLMSPGEPPGMPVLPTKVIEIAIPSGANVKGVSVTGSEINVRSNFVPYPAQPPQRFQDAKIDFIQPNHAAYTSDQITPMTLGELTGDHSMNGFQYVMVRLNPFRYLPSEKQLMLVTNMEIVLEYEPPVVQPTLRSRRIWEDTRKSIQARVINPETLDAMEFPPLLDDSSDLKGN